MSDLKMVSHEKQYTNEHTEAAARSDEQLQPEVSPVTRTLGAATDSWHPTALEQPIRYIGPIITNDKWIANLLKHRDTESFGV